MYSIQCYSIFVDVEASIFPEGGGLDRYLLDLAKSNLDLAVIVFRKKRFRRPLFFWKQYTLSWSQDLDVWKRIHDATKLLWGPNLTFFVSKANNHVATLLADYRLYKSYLVDSLEDFQSYDTVEIQGIQAVSSRLKEDEIAIAASHDGNPLAIMKRVPG